MTGRARTVLMLTITVVVLALTVIAYRQLFWNQAVAHPGNIRPLLAQFKTERGEIFAGNGAILATNSKTENGFERLYPQGELFAAVVGYFDPIRGRSGLEAAAEQWLGDGRSRGLDLTLTLDPDLQAEAARLLAGRTGAIVAIDPETGAILAMVSAPSFDPNSIGQTADTLDDGVLLNRAIAGRYPPGSTFKIITAAAALDEGVAQPDSQYDGPASLPVHGSQVTNYGKKDAGRLTVEEAFAKSTNTIFAQLGLALGADRLRQAGARFGLGATIPFDLPVAVGELAPPQRMDPVMTAWSAVGQGETLVTPLQMALATAAASHGGVIMEPFIIAEVRDYQGALKHRRRPRLWRRAMTEKTATAVKDMMIATVISGTGRSAAIPGIKVGGKTGTAEVGGAGTPHSWFVGFAPAGKPRVVLAVIIENGGTGGSTAAPLAGELFRKALTRSP